MLSRKKWILLESVVYLIFASDLLAYGMIFYIGLYFTIIYITELLIQAFKKYKRNKISLLLKRSLIILVILYSTIIIIYPYISINLTLLFLTTYVIIVNHLLNKRKKINRSLYSLGILWISLLGYALSGFYADLFRDEQGKILYDVCLPYSNQEFNNKNSESHMNIIQSKVNIENPFEYYLNPEFNISEIFVLNYSSCIPVLIKASTFESIVVNVCGIYSGYVSKEVIYNIKSIPLYDFFGNFKEYEYIYLHILFHSFIIRINYNNNNYTLDLSNNSRFMPKTDLNILPIMHMKISIIEYNATIFLSSKYEEVPFDQIIENKTMNITHSFLNIKYLSATIFTSLSMAIFYSPIIPGENIPVSKKETKRSRDDY
ncbi:MAG: hypothetical protein ACTSU2_05995 [Promethearchaeota archaeon]